MSRKDDLTYRSHLMLDQILSAQQPVSGQHDEMLFIIQHQTSELWLRLIIQELGAGRTALAEGRLPPALKALSRVAVVFEQLVKSWDVLRTLTPIDFASFRGSLGSASGFQSHQYRMVEFMLGNRDPAMLDPLVSRPEDHAALVAELEAPSVYQAALAWLGQRLDTNLTAAILPSHSPHRADAAVETAWKRVYADPDANREAFALAEALVEIEDQFRRWRFNHVTTVERVIGNKRGTGGTSGVDYLRRKLDVELFPELWNLRSSL